MSIFATRSAAAAQAAVDGIYENVSRRISAASQDVCPVELVKSFLDLCHAQSCGKCTPCRAGLGQLSRMLEQLLNGDAPEGILNKIEKTAQVIADSADCAIGYNAADMVRTSLQAFRDDFTAHLSGKCLASHGAPVPCQAACPAGVDIPGYISLIADGRPADAVRLIRKDNPFPIACAYICEHPCEAHCRRSMLDAPLNIRGLKKYAAVEGGEVPQPACAAPTGKKIAVIGGGPSGLTCAYYLALMGHSVTVYERHQKLGGMLRYGIPSYRLSREELDREIESILSVGIEVHTGVEFGKDITREELDERFDAVYTAIGAQLEKNARLEGSDAEGVVSAVALLGGIGDGILPDYKGKKVAIIGGGNVAMDATRTSLRLGAEKVTCVYRRRQCDMTALPEEIEGALAEGAELLTLEAPVRVEKDENGRAAYLVTQPQLIGEIDSHGRPRISAAALPERKMPVDIVVLAIGQDVDKKLLEGAAFMGGDCETGPATAIKAIAAGKKAAFDIDKSLGFSHDISVDVALPAPKAENKPRRARINLSEREALERKNDFEPIERLMTCEEACGESSRCLHCDFYGCGAFKGGRREE